MVLKPILLAAVLSVIANLASGDTGNMTSMVDGSLKPLMAPMDKMMSSMPMKSTGNPDADFLLMMLPHHQSAVDMAQVELANGKDEATRLLAQMIIDAQKAEILQMQSMLKAMGVTPPAMN